MVPVDQPVDQHIPLWTAACCMMYVCDELAVPYLIDGLWAQLGVLEGSRCGVEGKRGNLHHAQQRIGDHQACYVQAGEFRRGGRSSVGRASQYGCPCAADMGCKSRREEGQEKHGGYFLGPEPKNNRLSDMQNIFAHCNKGFRGPQAVEFRVT